MRILVTALVGFVIIVAACAAASQPAAAQDTHMTRAAKAATEWSAAKRRKPHRAARVTAPSTQIACTRAGCGPIPPGCGAVKERTVDDSPSGFEIIVCPRRY
jgi:hypothetical protein